MLLALDTSTSYASIALARPDHTIAELTWDVGRRHSTELLQRLHWLLDTHGIAMRDLTAVAVATGPGSFNGVRVALATAKSLAFALGIPLYGHPTLDVIAWGSSDVQGIISALLEAGRGQSYTARYSAPAESPLQWQPLDGYHILTPAEVALRSRGTVLFCGEWREETRAQLVEALDEPVRFRSALGPRRASWLAELTLARIEAGVPASDPASIEPLYLRRPAITTSARRAHWQRGDVRAAWATPEVGGEGAPHALQC